MVKNPRSVICCGVTQQPRNRQDFSRGPAQSEQFVTLIAHCLNLYEISIENLLLYVGLSSVEFRKLSSLFLYPFAMSITGERHNRKKLKSLRTYVRTPKPPLMLQSFEKSTMTNLLCLIKAY